MASPFLGGGSGGAGGGSIRKNVEIVYTVNGQAETAQANKKAEEGVKKIGEAAKKQAAGVEQLKSAWKSIGNAYETVTGIFGKLNQAWEGAKKVYDFLKVALAEVNPSLDQLLRTQSALTDEMIKSKTGLSDLGSSLDTYAQKLGLANAAALSLLQTEEARRAIARGQVLNRDAAAGRFQLKNEERTALVRKALRDNPNITDSGLALAYPEIAALDAELKKISDEESYTGGRDALGGLVGAARGVASRAGYAASGAVNLLTDRTRRYIDAWTAKARKGGGGGGARVMGEPDQFENEMDADAEAARLAMVQDRNNATLSAGRDMTAGLGFDVFGMDKQFESMTDAIAVFRSEVAAVGDDFTNLDLQFVALAESQMKGWAQMAAGAVLFGNGSMKAVNQALKGLALLCATEAFFAFGKAAVSLGFGDVASAAEFAKGGAIYTAGALAAGVGAAATGGLRGGGGGGSRGGVSAPGADSFSRPSQDRGPTQINVSIGMSRSIMHDAVVQESDARDGRRSTRRIPVGR